MDNKNNKLEDFFNQSINHFDDSPSDLVWEGVQQRLDDDLTVWDKFSRSFRKYFPYLVLLLGLSTYHLFVQHKISDIRTQLDTTLQENAALGIQIKDCGDQSASLLTQVQNVSAQLQTSELAIGQLENNLLTTNFITNNLRSRNKTYQSTISELNRYQDFKHSIPSKPSIVSTPTPVITKNEIIENGATSLPAELKNDPTISITNKVSKNGVAKNSVGFSIKNSLPKISFKPTNNLPTFGGFFNNTFVKMNPFNEPKKRRASKLRIGYEFQAFRTINNISNAFNFGHSNGVRLEWIFNNKFAITGAINFSDQQYTVRNPSGYIPAMQLAEFPKGTSQGLNVDKISVENHYLNLPVGFKFPILRFGNNFNIYLNPAVAWQFQFPQKYQYSLDSDTNFGWVNKQYYAYLGTANLTVGLEKAIHKNMIWQLGFYGEKSLVEFGAEKEHFSTVGISTAILFQR